MEPWQIAEENGIEIVALESAVWVFGASLKDRGSFADDNSKSHLGRILPILIPQLIELGLAREDGANVRISYDHLARLRDADITFFDELLKPAPFTLEIKLRGSLGFPGCEFVVKFFNLDSGQIEPEIRGCLSKSSDEVFRIDPLTYELLQSIQDFNGLSPLQKATAEAYRSFNAVKKLADELGIVTDPFTSSRTIIEPDEIEVGVAEEEGDRISLVPQVEGVEDEELRRAFNRFGSGQEFYDVGAPDGGRATVVLSEGQREAVSRMREVERFGGVDRAAILSHPEAVFEGVIEHVSLTGFGPRVLGIGEFPFAAQPFIRGSVTGIFDDARANELAAGQFEAGIRCKFRDGTEEDLQFGSTDEVVEFANEVEAAYKSGSGIVKFRGKSIGLNDQFVTGVRELLESVVPKPRDDHSAERPPLSNKYLLIFTNEDELDYEQSTPEHQQPRELELPRSLRSDIQFKEHQQNGVRWLQHNFNLNRAGCLLADDMGLGKTLQVLVFLAWLIEQGGIVTDEATPDRPPWKPILIVAPVILIDNETWINDMRAFFENDGSIFLPWLTLRGSELSRLKREVGRETLLGRPLLDLDELRKYRVVLTNYETVINYQHSFAMMNDHWSVVVTDEAQEYKTPNTKVSHALKSLAPRFRVAATGTPVETKLFDVWNIFDFLQPGRLLGSAKEFRARYERSLDDAEGIQGAIKQLKERLSFDSPSSYLLRRDKTELTDLPTKHIHTLDCHLMPSQREYHLELLRRAGRGGDGNHPFSLIQEFLRLYQHPSLVPKFEPVGASEAIETCDKLRVLVENLKRIRSNGEKVLVFVRTIDMQQILASVLSEEFGLDIKIVNGTTKTGSTGEAETRRGIIDRFKNSLGFDVLILSPEVAGMGLTLTEANHVFHYGRWWNPAKEAQATDRVYRIGQQKDVHIYYLIAKDPKGEFETFDEKLDTLLRRRLALASDFLAPVPGEDQLRTEFLGELFDQTRQH